MFEKNAIFYIQKKKEERVKAFEIKKEFKVFEKFNENFIFLSFYV